MRRITRTPAIASAMALVLALGTAGPATDQGVRLAGTAEAARGAVQRYLVLYARGASSSHAAAAIRAAGGRIVRQNERIGLATVISANPVFLQAIRASRVISGAMRDRPIGRAPQASRPKDNEIEKLTAERRAWSGVPSQGRFRRASAPEPLSWLQWGNQMIHATSSGSYAVQRGNRGVLVGIMDTGIDGSHPDIAPNFSRELSRNFTVDDPLVDGACAEDPDGSCSDPADVDENGHGTHVAGIVASPINGLGVSGVAPNVTLVNLRAGQDSGYFFLQATLDGWTYAADIGVDVVNMSFFTDPWLYNCRNHPADSPEERAQQALIIDASNRALDYAWSRGVTLIGSAGNQAQDLGAPTKIDEISPDYPPGSEKTRTVDNSCLDIPTEGNHVMSIVALGPSTAKADYSSYGVEQATVSAPGGFFRDYFGTRRFRSPTNMILAPYPESVARANGEVNRGGGVPNNPFVIRNCTTGVARECAYYQYLQGTSMAAPYASGVAALIVSQHGIADTRPGRGGLMMAPSQVEAILTGTATEHACPTPRTVSYVQIGRPPEWDATCHGGPEFNGFYGHGIVDALNAVTAP